MMNEMKRSVKINEYMQSCNDDSLCMWVILWRLIV